jgi:hypothetical protein
MDARRATEGPAALNEYVEPDGRNAHMPDPPQ